MAIPGRSVIAAQGSTVNGAVWDACSGRCGSASGVEGKRGRPLAAAVVVPAPPAKSRRATGFHTAHLPSTAYGHLVGLEYLPALPYR